MCYHLDKKYYAKRKGQVTPGGQKKNFFLKVAKSYCQKNRLTSGVEQYVTPVWHRLEVAGMPILSYSHL